MFIAILFALSVCFLMVLVRLIAGQTTYDRVLAANTIGTIIVLAVMIDQLQTKFIKKEE